MYWIKRELVLENKKRRWFPWQAKKAVDKELKELLDRINQRPRNPGLHQRLAELYLDRGDTARAIEAFIRAAECYKEAGFYLRAIALYRRILRMNRESPGILLKLAELYTLNGLFGDALVQFRKVIRYCKQEGRESQGILALQKLARTDPDNHQLRMKFIELMEEEGLHVAAFNGLLDLYNEIKNDHENPHVDEIRERVRRLYPSIQGDIRQIGTQIDIPRLQQRAEEILEGRASREIQPSNTLQTEEEALEELELTDELLDEPSEGEHEVSIQKRLQEAKVYTDHGLWDEAESVYKEVLDRFPRHTEALKGMEYIAKQKKISIKVDDSSSPRPLEMTAADLASQSDLEDDAYRTFLNGGPGEQPVDAAVRYELALAYKELGMVNECIEELIVASKDPAVSFECHRELANCYQDKGEIKKAIDHLEIALR